MLDHKASRLISGIVPPYKQVIILSYSRSGSSLLGEAFNQNPAAFYWFEPLKGVYEHLYGFSSQQSTACFEYKNGSERYLFPYISFILLVFM